METPEKPDATDSDATAAPVSPGSDSATRSVADAGANQPPRPISEDSVTVITKQSSLRPRPFVTSRELGALLVGATLGQIRLDEFIGGGGMGAVFRGEDTRLGRPVAVKVISGDRTDEDTLRRFHNEAQSAARLDHPNIARVYHVGEDDGWHYIVFEYIKGVNIRDLVEFKGPLPVDEAMSYTLQVAKALEHAYRRDVVHRDIKPSNVLVMPNGDVKLVDMGLARLHDVESPKDDITASGVTLGTFDYISPEQARDPRAADVRSDLYSLGCTLYFMLTGQPPFPDGTVLQKLLNHSSEEPPDVRIFRPELEDEVVALLVRLMAKQPLDRHQSPEELIEDIYVAAGRLDLPLTPPSGAPIRDPRGPSWAGHIAPWFAGFLLMAATAFGVEWLDPGRNLSGPEIPEYPAFPATTDEVTPAPEFPVEAEPAAIAQTAPDSVVEPILGWNDRQLPFDWIDWPEAAGLVGDAAATSSPSSMSADTPNTAAPAISRIIVAPSPLFADSGSQAIVVDSLTAALEAIDLHSTATTIELRFNGKLPQPPIRMVLSRPLTIAAGAGYQPTLSFEPRLSELAASLNVVEVAGESLTLAGVNLDLKLPPEPADGWTFVFLEDVESLQLTNCTLTLRNSDESGVPRQPNVAFLGFEGRMLRREMRMPNGESESERPRPPIRIVQLSGVAVRGEAAFMRLTSTESIALNWTQGLLAISGRFAEIVGAPAFPEANVHLDLDSVTIAAQEGLARVDLAESTAPPAELHLNLNRCVVDSLGQGALVEHLGVAKESLAERRFSFSGSENYYTDAIGLRWLMRLQDGREVVNAFDEKDAAWYQELQGVKAVMWKSLPGDDIPLHQRLKSDYRQDERPANPSANAGFAFDAVPDFPVFAPEMSQDTAP